MGQSYFQFKQFRVEQKFAAMKVCTDACIIGAYVSKEIQLDHAQKVLDIGTGTGLLSLMYAQKNKARIDAIEIDTASAKQAKENFASSPWHRQLDIICADVITWEASCKYDLIITNPPFYEADLKSPDSRRNNALHSASLSLRQLLLCIIQNLNNDGRVAILLPAGREEDFKSAIANHPLFIEKLVYIYQKKQGPLFRFIAILTFQEITSLTESFIIYNHDNSYTNQFINLLHDYYLKL